jgi:hypothetical protein
MWGSLLIGVVTGLVALSGVFYTQWRADQRERQRWDRERAHERAIWDRDDAARSYEHRREAYMTFLNTYQISRDAISLAEESLISDPSENSEFLAPLYRSVGEVQVFGTRAAFERATEAYELLRRLCFGPSEDAPTLRNVDMAQNAFVDQLRRDLHVSDE